MNPFTKFATHMAFIGGSILLLVLMAIGFSHVL